MKLNGHYYDSDLKSANFNTFTGAASKYGTGSGILNDSTVGLTWHVNANTKIQFNWIHAMLNNTAKGHSTADLFVGRIQVGF